VFIFIFIVIIGLFDNNKTANFFHYTIENYTEINKNDEEIIKLIDGINYHNSKISNIQTYVSINIVDNPFILRGYLCHQKELYFRMEVNSTIGKELDIGSNLNVFWFWSRRMRPPTLYYAHHQNLYNTRLKTPFHPLWMMECLNIGKINSYDYVFKNDEYLLIVEIRKSTLNRLVKKKTLIDTKKKIVVGHYLSDLEDRNIASAEIIEFQVINELLIPKKIKFCWYEENKILYWNLYQTRINININSSNWLMPNYRNSINIEN
jgi:hypothetical protein